MGLLLGVILLVSAIFRIPGLSHFPPELFGDEVDVGYQAISLFHTGRDYYNQALPLYLHSFSEWRQGLIVYQVVPTIAIFGNSPLGVRLPEAIFGTLTPILLFLTVYQFSRSKSWSFLSSLSLALMPWHIMYSRMAAFGATTLIDFLLIAILLYRKRHFFLSFLFFALCFYTYSTAFIFVPLILVVSMIFIKSRPQFYHFIYLAILLLPIVIFLWKGPAGQRFGVLSYSSQSTFVDQIQTTRVQYPSLVGKSLSNRYTASLNLFSQNYLRSFSTDFLFVRGDPVVRSSLQVVGQLLPLTAPFLFLGLFLLAKKRQWFWLSWLILAPIPSALTFDGAWHATRLFLMVPPLAVATGLGLSEFLNLFTNFPKVLASVLVLGLFSVHFFGVAAYYIYVYPSASWRWWPTGYSQIMSDLRAVSPQYSHVFINNTYEPSLVRFLFWTNYSPQKFHQEFVLDQPHDQIAPGYQGFSLGDKYYFGDFQTKNGGEYFNQLASDSVYLISQRDNVPGNWDWSQTPPAGVKVVSTVKTPLGDPLFYLIAKK